MPLATSVSVRVDAWMQPPLGARFAGLLSEGRDYTERDQQVQPKGEAGHTEADQ